MGYIHTEPFADNKLASNLQLVDDINQIKMLHVFIRIKAIHFLLLVPGNKMMFPVSDYTSLQTLT